MRVNIFLRRCDGYGEGVWFGGFVCVQDDRIT
ncbi:hypothetical protein DPX39_060041700 [Trypanosoma brucei equiperdum]|uniref:Uncharacterized protein n=1 Tax=Trypanosoma brucei equiperdum TaxID=630700 RepID=A0A3L6L970_9TRYP|nr:hypothetical protein DPX39_060041700 [Trypanosoma brucei equiperdum]